MDKNLPNLLVLSNPAGLYDPAPNGYSHLAIIDSKAKLIVVSGQGGETEDGTLDPDFRTQVRQALRNLSTAVVAAGGALELIAKLTVLIVDHTQERLAVFGEELGRLLGDNLKPACTLIPVPRLALDGMLFEVEALAVVGQSV